MSDEYIEWIPRTGFNSVIYQTDGTHPAYNNNYPFEITFVDGAEYIWETKGYTTKEENLLKITNTEHNKLTVRPASLYDGYCVNTSVACKVMKQGQQLAYINIPIHMYFNRFGQEALNDWDGNSIQLDEEGGHIYSPQVGAGIKDSNNRFTGVLMGKVKEHSNSQELIGLLGYNEGVRSIFLDSKTGKAEFGAAGGGQIILDPRDKTAKIYSSDYSTVDKKGMLIDFTTPEIKFGSGYFNVDKDGWLTAQRGTIAGWEIGDTSLGKGYVGISSDNSSNDNMAFWAGVSKQFNVTYNGKLTAKDADIKGNIDADSGTIGDWLISGSNLTNDKGTVVLNPYQFTLGDFTVDANGDMYANGAKLDNVTANQGTMTNVNATGGTFTNITAVNITATSGKFTGDITANNITANKGTIAGWTIGANTISKGSTQLSSSSTNGKITTSNIEINDGKIYINGSEGWMALGWGTDHLATTGLNVAASNGISFRSGMTYNSIGTAQGSIGQSGNAILIRPADGNRVVIGHNTSGARIEIDSTQEITLRSQGALWLRSYNASYCLNIYSWKEGKYKSALTGYVGLGGQYGLFMDGILVGLSTDASTFSKLGYGNLAVE